MDKTKNTNISISIKKPTEGFSAQLHFKDKKYHCDELFLKKLKKAKDFSKVEEMEFFEEEFLKVIHDSEIIKKYSILQKDRLLTLEEIFWTTSELTNDSPEDHEIPEGCKEHDHSIIIGYYLSVDGVIYVFSIAPDKDLKQWNCRCREFWHSLMYDKIIVMKKRKNKLL